MSKVCIIMRGVPGSGKSYRANELLIQYGGNPDGHVFSTDNYFIPVTREMRKSGEYVGPDDELAEYKSNWAIDKLHAAHSNNLREFKNAVDQWVTPVIVDNTNVKARDCRAYVQYAKDNEYEIKIEEPTSPWWKEYAPFLLDKQANSKKVAEFAQLLFSKNKHGVPLDAIRGMLDKWQPNLTVSKILGEV
jgi:hypothetical protein